MSRPYTASSTQRGYSSKYRKARHRLLKGGPPCHHCGQPATEADHRPEPLWSLRARGADLDSPEVLATMVPSCTLCARRQGQAERVRANRARTRQARTPTRIVGRDDLGGSRQWL